MLIFCFKGRLNLKRLRDRVRTTKLWTIYSTHSSKILATFEDAYNRACKSGKKTGAGTVENGSVVNQAERKSPASPLNSSCWYEKDTEDVAPTDYVGPFLWEDIAGIHFRQVQCQQRTKTFLLAWLSHCVKRIMSMTKGPVKDQQIKLKYQESLEKAGERMLAIRAKLPF
ncbi:predicted protein [Sclerotinia sclerotiorum 1980 UF-70]|uniref:Uncharacterized protein n=1 Tax=Sclerotinia sclerotiorum (strain ATCC 18683 / 1980 / Ss-1) TaxID=665079 RepID=A7E7D5_SCLS1|nr:predicted protein [Sclerotinia sclerotiorum 1980 UF-70]EDN96287.1 predicted protein [Sclerotinia sclerotiorum 1980 UF-70]